MTKRILVCADDYGQTLPISQAILSLIAKKRITAVSCMVTAKNWLQYAEFLKPYRGEIEIGLHFNLTHEKPLSASYCAYYGDTFQRLHALLLKSQFHYLKKEIIEAELKAQWQQFENTLGNPPDFVDGHQHIHQFPIIREVLIEFLLQKPKPWPFIRLVNPKGWIKKGNLIKNIIIKLSGTSGLQALLNKYHFNFNRSFTGIYPFERAKQYQEYVRQFLEEIEDRGLMMCHPGLENAEENLPMSASRPLEYAYLASDAFLADLAKARVSIERFKY